MIKYYIRSTGERYLDESYNQIPYVELIDKDHRYIDFFVDKLEELGNEDIVIIEDDCVLCKDFKNRIEAVIAQYPNKIINFFQMKTKEWYKTRESDYFLQNQCTYYPKGLTIKLAREMRKVHKEFPKLATDRCEDMALKRMNETHIQYRPCLVQHLNFDTMLNHEIENLRTPFFIDYLDKYKFDYNKLSKMHYGILINEMKRHIEEKRAIWIEQKMNPRKLKESIVDIKESKKKNENDDLTIKYFVRTTLERELNKSYNQIEYELLIDREHRPVESFIEQLEIISDYDAVLLEDDVLLCKDFKNRIEEVIKKYPDTIINFFTRPWEHFETGSYNQFSWNQCTYYPKGLGKEIANQMRQIYSIMLENKNILEKKYLTSTGYIQYGLLESKALENLGLEHIRYRPCLVQHLDLKSLIGNDDEAERTTIYFIDYLDELNVDYNNLTNEEINKLKSKRQDFFEKEKASND